MRGPGHGRRFYWHIECGMEPGSDGRAQYDMRWEWRRCLEEGLLDGITLKQVPIGSRFFCELRELADARRVPTYETPWIANHARDRNSGQVINGRSRLKPALVPSC